MHELSIATSIASAVTRHAEGARVERVRIDVGQLRQVVAGSLAFCWEMVADGTPLAGSQLDIREVPAAIECRDCGHAQGVEARMLRCEACGATAVTVTAGDELLIRSYDLVEA